MKVHQKAVYDVVKYTGENVQEVIEAIRRSGAYSDIEVFRKEGVPRIYVGTGPIFLNHYIKPEQYVVTAPNFLDVLDHEAYYEKYHPVE